MQKENFIKQVTGWVGSWPDMRGLVKCYAPSHVKVYNYPPEYVLEQIEFVYSCISSLKKKSPLFWREILNTQK